MLTLFLIFKNVYRTLFFTTQSNLCVQSIKMTIFMLYRMGPIRYIFPHNLVFYSANIGCVLFPVLYTAFDQGPNVVHYRVEKYG